MITRVVRYAGVSGERIWGIEFEAEEEEEG